MHFITLPLRSLPLQLLWGLPLRALLNFLMHLLLLCSPLSVLLRRLLRRSTAVLAALLAAALDAPLAAVLDALLATTVLLCSLHPLPLRSLLHRLHP